MSAKKRKDVIRELRVDEISEPSERIRMEIDEDGIKELAESIRSIGLQQAIQVVEIEGGYEIVFGHRRWLAHKKLGLKRIKAVVVEKTAGEVKLARGIENIQHLDLTPVEEGATYFDLVENVGWSVEELAERMGKSAGLIKRRMAILRMPESFQKALHLGKVSMSVAEEIWSCPDVAHREYLLEMAVEHGVTQAVARLWVHDWKKAQRGAESGAEGGGGLREPLESEPIYRGCDICRGPVELREIKELRLCRGCLAAVLEAVKKGGG